jgi:hypothetical protein
VTLNTTIGWSTGDDVRVLAATNMPIGVYQIKQIQADMNYLGNEIDNFVISVQDLLDAYDNIQTKLSTLNNESGGKVLTKADVLEWSVAGPGQNYGPERELMRISSLLIQYFASSPLFNGIATTNITALHRS